MSRVLQTPHQTTTVNTPNYATIFLCQKKHSINDLRKNDQIVVKSAGKGSDVVIYLAQKGLCT